MSSWFVRFRLALPWSYNSPRNNWIRYTQIWYVWISQIDFLFSLSIRFDNISVVSRVTVFFSCHTFRLIPRISNFCIFIRTVKTRGCPGQEIELLKDDSVRAPYDRLYFFFFFFRELVKQHCCDPFSNLIYVYTYRSFVWVTLSARSS